MFKLRHCVVACKLAECIPSISSPADADRPCSFICHPATNARAQPWVLACRSNMVRGVRYHSMKRNAPPWSQQGYRQRHVKQDLREDRRRHQDEARAADRRGQAASAKAITSPHAENRHGGEQRADGCDTLGGEQRCVEVSADPVFIEDDGRKRLPTAGHGINAFTIRNWQKYVEMRGGREKIVVEVEGDRRNSRPSPEVDDFEIRYRGGGDANLASNRANSSNPTTSGPSSDRMTANLELEELARAR